MFFRKKMGGSTQSSTAPPQFKVNHKTFTLPPLIYRLTTCTTRERGISERLLYVNLLYTLTSMYYYI